MRKALQLVVLTFFGGLFVSEQLPPGSADASGSSSEQIARSLPIFSRQLRAPGRGIFGEFLCEPVGWAVSWWGVVNSWAP